MRSTALAFLFPLMVVGCREKTDDTFELVNMDEFEFEATSLNEGEKVEILGYSGGPNCNADTEYYLQYLVRRENGDTVRVFSSCSTFDWDSGVREGSFVSDDILAQLRKKYTGDRESLLVFNRELAPFEQGRKFKTVFGSIGFGDAGAATGIQLPD